MVTPEHGVLTDQMIEWLSRYDGGLLSPFDPAKLSSMGYDLTLSNAFKMPITDGETQLVDPFNPPPFREVITDRPYIVVPSGGFVLGASVEYVRMPRDVIGICLGRSSYARAALIVHVTPLEPGWEGNVTIEISNTNPLPVLAHIGKGITQVVFFRAARFPLKDYAAKGGRYQGQTGVTLGRPDKL